MASRFNDRLGLALTGLSRFNSAGTDEMPEQITIGELLEAKAPAKGYAPLYDNYLRHMKALHDQAGDFLAEVKRRAPSRTHEAELLIDGINSDWRSVRPETGARRSPSGAFRSRAEVFDPARWPEVDARALHSAIKLCGDKFNIACSYYNRLLPAEKKLVRGMRP